MNMKVLVGLVALLSAIALCTILNLASGVFIPLVVDGQLDHARCSASASSPMPVPSGWALVITS